MRDKQRIDLRHELAQSAGCWAGSWSTAASYRPSTEQHRPTVMPPCRGPTAVGSNLRLILERFGAILCLIPAAPAGASATCVPAGNRFFSADLVCSRAAPEEER